MAKKRTPMIPGKKCPCGFMATDRQAWHFHHKNVDCDHYAQVLADRAQAEYEEEAAQEKYAIEHAAMLRSAWVTIHSAPWTVEQILQK